MNNMHMRFFCKWCGRKTGGCMDACHGPHSHEEVACCATCAHRPFEELQAIEAMPDNPEVTHSILGLVMENPPSLETVSMWMPGQRRAAEDWAGREHFYASDNLDVERVRRPHFIHEDERELVA